MGIPFTPVAPVCHKQWNCMCRINGNGLLGEAVKEQSAVRKSRPGRAMVLNEPVRPAQAADIVAAPGLGSEPIIHHGGQGDTHYEIFCAS